MWPFSPKKQGEANEAYERREGRQPWQALIYFTDDIKKQRLKNHRLTLNGPKMLRDIDDVDIVTPTFCDNCKRLMTLQFEGNTRNSTLWLACCDRGQGSSSQSLGARDITSY